MNAARLDTLHDGTARIFAMHPLSPPSGRYGEAQRPNWAAIMLIVALHAILLFALVKLDVIHVRRPAPAPLVMTLVPEAAPPPAAPPPAAAVPDVAVPHPIVVPEPEVKVAQPAPSPIVVATVPAPPAPSAAPAIAAPPAPLAEPITPPSANAATLANPAPRYPIEARRKKQEGTVRLRVVITIEGRVKEIAIARSSGYDVLDDAALAAVRRWKFVPGMQGGRPVEAVGFVPIPFHLTA